MKFDWTQYLWLAEQFVQSPPEEFNQAYLRTAVSRAYYGAFGSVRNFLANKRGIMLPTDRSAHEFVINQLKAGESDNEQRIGLWLDRLRRERNIADYEDSSHFDSNRAKLPYFMALQVINGLKQL